MISWFGFLRLQPRRCTKQHEQFDESFRSFEIGPFARAMQSGILIFVVVLVVGVFAFAVGVRYFRQRTAGNAPKLPLTEIARAAFASSDPSTRSPTGPMAARLKKCSAEKRTCTASNSLSNTHPDKTVHALLDVQPSLNLKRETMNYSNGFLRLQRRSRSHTEEKQPNNPDQSQRYRSSNLMLWLRSIVLYSESNERRVW